jgi:hemerythrin-like domain-containing protein
VDLVNVLLKQHEAGRALTSQIIQLTNAGALNDASQKRTLRESIAKFVRMYEPHAAREDTVVFPAYRKLGGDGFEQGVEAVTRMEKALGIYDLAESTPKT